MSESSALIMGIVNVTPDSFSDGGRFFTSDLALGRIEKLLQDGADIIDIGAESTRPDAAPVPLEEEWRRLKPVLAVLDQQSLRISVDTYKPEIMRRLLDHRVEIINDVQGAGQVDDAFLSQWAKLGRCYLPMHMHRDPKSMQTKPLSLEECKPIIQNFYEATQARLLRLGFPRDKIWLDPGIGFGKNDQANLYLIRDALQRAAETPIALGISRKSFIGRLLDIESPEERDAPSKMLELAFLFAGVKAVRTHNVRHLRRLKDMITP
ncbi:MAG: dihydropteroate synthase [Oligoflexus sp.]|nr:dihydropteroate synthase [Oligoflexus sp.]